MDKIFLKGEIIQKRCKIELWFFDTALHLMPSTTVKFKQIISKGFQVMLRTRQWMDRRTEGQGGDYMLSLWGA
jgi:hypothetical protein